MNQYNNEALYIVMPAYNEEENIETVVTEWYSILQKFGNSESRFIVADSGSTDSTHQILLKLLQKFPQLEILSDTEKQHGPKLMALYDYSIKHGAEYIFQTDADGQTNPDEFQQFWDLRQSYDAVIGVRLARGDGKIRRLVEIILCQLLHLYFKVTVSDANAPFRLMKKDLVKRYLYRLPENYNLPNVMLTTYFSFYQEKVKYENISFKPRQGGKNSINIPKIVKIGWQAMKDFRSFKKICFQVNNVN